VLYDCLVAGFGGEYLLRGSKCKTNPIVSLLQQFIWIFGRKQTIYGGLPADNGAEWPRITVSEKASTAPAADTAPVAD
jgi:hypothetical protein